MSNIAKARDILNGMLELELEDHVHDGIREALAHMHRSKRGLQARGKPNPLTAKDVERCHELRAGGMSMHEIALKYGVGQGIIWNSMYRDNIT